LQCRGRLEPDTHDATSSSDGLNELGIRQITRQIESAAIKPHFEHRVRKFRKGRQRVWRLAGRSP